MTQDSGRKLIVPCRPGDMNAGCGCEAHAMKRISALALIGGSAFAAGLPARAEGATLSVAATPVADAVPYFYAQSTGLFDRAGLTVNQQLLGSGAAIAAAVAGGVADVGFSNVQTLVAARSKGIPFVILAAGGEYNDALPTTQLLVRTDAPIHVAKDLEGKIVVVGALHDLQSLSVLSWMAANGADPSKVNFIESPASAALALLQQKRADAIFVSEPNLHIALASGSARVLANAYSAIAKRLPVSAWFALQSFASSRADVAKRFADVMRHASDDVNAHPGAMDPLISDYTKIPLATLHAMAHAHQGSAVDAAGLQSVIDASAAYHLIDKPFPAKDLIALL
jgi:NitT/TauT family transport system substrate-binding protein